MVINAPGISGEIQRNIYIQNNKVYLTVSEPSVYYANYQEHTVYEVKVLNILCIHAMHIITSYGVTSIIYPVSMIRIMVQQPVHNANASILCM